MTQADALTPDSDETKALRVLAHAREDLVRTRVALANRLCSELEAFWPGAACTFFEVDSPIALSFLERYPSPKTRALWARNASRPGATRFMTDFSQDWHLSHRLL